MSNPKQLTAAETFEALKEATKIIEEKELALETGACLFVPPQGESWCRQLSRETCASIGGTFLGGTCP